MDAISGLRNLIAKQYSECRRGELGDREVVELNQKDADANRISQAAQNFFGLDGLTDFPYRG